MSDDSTDSESEADKSATPAKNGIQEDQTRRSGRIQQRSSRSFSLPSREQIWDKIPSTPFRLKRSCDDVKPRRLVNNFTKENSRYNYDPAYTSGEESVEDFVVPDDEVEYEDSSRSEDGGDENDNSKKDSSDVSSDRTNERNVSHRRLRTCQKKVHRRSPRHDEPSHDESSGSERSDNSEKRDSQRVMSSTRIVKPVVSSSYSSDEGSLIASPRKKLCKRLLMENSSSEAHDFGNNDHSVKKSDARVTRSRSKKTRKRGVVKKFLNTDGASDARNMTNSEQGSSSMSRDGKEETRRKAVIESSNESEWSSDNYIPSVDDRKLVKGLVKSSDEVGMAEKSCDNESPSGQKYTNSERKLIGKNCDHNEGILAGTCSPFYKALKDYVNKAEVKATEKVLGDRCRKASVESESDPSSAACSDRQFSDVEDTSGRYISESEEDNGNGVKSNSNRKVERSCTKMSKSRQKIFSGLRAARKSKLEKS